MKKELREAKALVEKGKIKEALDLLKSMSVQFKGAISKCPGCGENAPMLQKDVTLHGECKKCGAVWGGKPTDDLVKVGEAMKDETKKLTKNQVIEQLWDLYRKGDPEADAFSITSFEATGWLKKTLAIKLGLPLPEEKLEKTEAPTPIRKGDTTISSFIRRYRDSKCFVKGDDQEELVEEHERLVDVLESPSHEDDLEEAKRQKKELAALKEGKEYSPVNKNDMTRDDVIDTMLGMFKAGEETALVNRHSIAKYETTGEITEEVLKVVFRKAKKDYNALCKAVDEEVLQKFDEDDDKHHKHMQRMIDDGSVWHFEGSMGRHAMDLMRQGHVTLGPKGHKDFYGNKVPAHHEVKPGTLGSKEYQKKMRQKHDDGDFEKTKIKKDVDVGEASHLAKEAVCKGCGKSSVLQKDSLCKKCGMKKTDKNSPRGREVLPEGELKEKMKDAGEYTGPAKPLVVKK